MFKVTEFCFNVLSVVTLSCHCPGVII